VKLYQLSGNLKTFSFQSAFPSAS